MAYNDSAVADAIAQRVAGITVPGGIAPIRGATSTPPDVLQVLPYAIVVPGSDSITYGAAATITAVQFTVRIYLGSPTDFARRFPALHAYRSALRERFLGAVTLGGLVDQASVISTSIGQDAYGSNDFVVVEAVVEATKGEAYASQA
jgi:hypothetical protein